MTKAYYLREKSMKSAQEEIDSILEKCNKAAEIRQTSISVSELSTAAHDYLTSENFLVSSMSYAGYSQWTISWGHAKYN